MVVNIAYFEMKCTVGWFHKKGYYKKIQNIFNKIKDIVGIKYGRVPVCQSSKFLVQYTIFC